MAELTEIRAFPEGDLVKLSIPPVEVGFSKESALILARTIVDAANQITSIGGEYEFLIKEKGKENETSKVVG